MIWSWNLGFESPDVETEIDATGSRSSHLEVGVRMRIQHSKVWSCLVAAMIGSAVGIPADAADNRSKDASTQKSWFQEETQKLYDALAVGDKAPWDEVLAADFIFTSEDGAVQDRQQFMADIAPLPQGSTGGIKVEDLTVRSVGDGAVAHYLMDEWEDVQGQHLHTKYFSTDVYRRVHNSWMLVASQATVVPRDLDAVAVDHSEWSRLVGDYQVSAKAKSRYHVFVDKGILYGGRDKKSATRLIPLSPLVYFQSGSIHTMVFVPGPQGKIIEVREIHKYNELVMTRASGAT